MKFSGPIELKAERSGALPSQFTGLAYSGAVIESRGLIVDLASTEVSAPMPLLDEHQRDRAAGVVERATKRNGQLLVSGRLFSDMQGRAGEQIAQLAARGLRFEMSIGLYGYTEDQLGSQQSATVNGTTVTGPLTILRNGRVRECSICVLGADRNTSASFFGHGASHQREQVARGLDLRDIYRRHNDPRKFDR